MKVVSDEVIIYILTYLRAIDLATLNEVDKTVFSKQKLQKAIQRIMMESPNTAIQTPSKKAVWVLPFDVLSPAALYVFEVTSILSAIAYPQPINEKGMFRLGSRKKVSIADVDYFRLLDKLCLGVKCQKIL